MAIADEDVQRVKELTDIVAVIGERVALRASGRSRMTGLCPFHAERTPSFSVNPQLGVYHCFGCGKGGDAIEFVRETLGLTFVEAVEHLAQRAGVQLQAADPREAEARKRRDAYLDAMGRAVDWYHERLLRAEDAGAARRYLRERGYDGEVVRRYRLGWAPDGFDLLCRALRLDDDRLRGTGLGYRTDSGRTVDAFRGRVIFPIFDHAGHPIGLGGRMLPGGREPKYKNTSETPLYRKSEVLYGLNWAKESILHDRTAVLCEGYTDVIAFHRAGVPGAVATCGTAATEDHVRRLKRFGATTLVLGYDADAAGQGAAARFYDWEQRHDLTIRVVQLPPGQDPGDLAHRDPEALRSAFDRAIPFLEFRLARVWAAADLASPEGRARAAPAAVAVVAEHPDELLRDQYAMQIADRCRLDPDTVRQHIRRARTGGARQAPAVGGPLPRRRRHAVPTHETDVLWFAVNDPASAAGAVHEDLFADEVARAAVHGLLSAETFEEAVAAADPDAAELLRRLATEDPPDADLENALTTLLRIRAAEIRASNLRLEPTPDELARIAGENAFLMQQAERLDDPAARPTAVEALVAFIAQRSREEAIDE